MGGMGLIHGLIFATAALLFAGGHVARTMRDAGRGLSRSRPGFADDAAGPPPRPTRR